MSNEPKTKIRKIECRTQGHAACKETLVYRRGNWQKQKIVHFVYGDRKIENFRLDLF